MTKPIFITGAAGFIGFHLCRKLLNQGINVLGIDNLNDYYDVKLKEKRLENLSEISLKNKNWKFFKTDLEEKEMLFEILQKYKPKTVINLAAQAGVRYSLENPTAYINSNIVGFSNILECCRLSKISNLIYASSSSVYGGNTKLPFSENDSVNHPVSLYAATKISNELMAHTYSHLYGIKSTGLRFFTVYGPWGRPDMAPMIFTDAIINNKPLNIFNFGNLSRSFTFIDDVVEIIISLIYKPASPDKFFKTDQPNTSSSWCAHRIFNVGSGHSIQIGDFISCLEDELGIKAIKNFCDFQNGDVKNTLSDNAIIDQWLGNTPKTSLKKGINLFINWYKSYYKLL